MTNKLDTVLLLALPASGKSETRTYLKSLSAEECLRDFHLGPTVQLDDFPYVHLMRRIDDELAALGGKGLFFRSPDQPFIHGLDWGTLIHLLNEDYECLARKDSSPPASAAELLFERLDRAAQAAGAPARLQTLAEDQRRALADKIEADAAALFADLAAARPDSMAGKTLVIEFARGGPQGAEMPLSGGRGYEFSLAHLSEPILARASILYVWVTPEESRRKNDARADPDDPGSILNHGVPIDVMLGDYGCDDLEYLEQKAERPGTVTVKAHGKTFHLPVARFDNRKDKTSFIRNDPADWQAQEKEELHRGLQQALAHLAQAIES